MVNKIFFSFIFFYKKEAKNRAEFLDDPHSPQRLKHPNSSYLVKQWMFFRRIRPVGNPSAKLMAHKARRRGFCY